MTPQDYQQVKALFAAVCDLSQLDRTRYLDQHCSDATIRSEVEALLSHDASSLQVDVVAARDVLAGDAPSSLNIDAQPGEGTIPDHVGPFRIVRAIGQGGMGTVFEAVQDHPQRRIALKLIRPGLHSARHLRRFHDEAEILGRLAHHGIARIFAAGTARLPGHVDEQPYFAMEYIDGQPLDAWIAHKQPGLRACVELLARIADAVHHAHQKGVIHRDLKPANILVEDSPQDPQPRVVDFGVARLIDPGAEQTLQTQAGQLLGTLHFMSPEQVGGDPDAIDLRTDVYALGVVAYRALTRRLPLELDGISLGDAIDRIRTTNPQPIGAIDSRLRGDLTTIVHKAMHKDPAQRYASAAELATDFRRFLRHEPIAARPPTLGYQLRKFAQRNRALTAAVLTASLTLVGATAYSTVQSQRAQQQAARADAVSDFLTELLGSIDPDRALGQDTTLLRQLLDEAAARLESEFGDQPDIAAELHSVIGQTYYSIAGYEQADFHAAAAAALTPEGTARYGRCLEQRANAQFGLGNLEQAGAYLQAAAPLLEQDPDRTAVERVNHLGSLAAIELWTGQREEAAETIQSALSLAEEAQLDDRDPVVLGVWFTEVQRLLENGDWAGGLPHLNRLEEDYRAVYGTQSPRLAEVLIRKGTALRWLTRYEEAEAVMVEAVAMHRDVLGQHDSTAEALDQLAELYVDRGRYAEAEPLYREGLAMRSELVEPIHIGYTTGLRRLGNVLRRTGKPLEAEPYHRQAVELLRTIDTPHRLGQALSDLSNDLISLGRYTDAEPLLLEAETLFEEAYDEPHPNMAAVQYALGRLYYRQRRFEDCETRHTRSLELRRQVYGQSHPEVALAIDALGSLHMARREYGPAEERNRESLTMARQFYPEGHPAIGKALNNLAVTLSAKGDRQQAIEIYEQVLELTENNFGREHREYSRTLFNMGASYYALKEYEPAEELISQAVEIERRVRTTNDPQRTYALVRLGSVLIDSGRPEEAVAPLAEAAEVRATAYGEPHIDTGTALSWLGEAQLKTRAFEDALATLERTDRNFANRPLHDSRRAAAARNRARALVGLQREEDAEALLLEVEEACREAVGPTHSRTQSARRLLVGLYERMEEPDEAQRWKDAIENGTLEP